MIIGGQVRVSDSRSREGTEPGPHGQDEVACAACGLDPVCRILGYGGDGSNLPRGLLILRRHVARGEAIFRCGDAFRSIFAVKSGSFKTFVPHAGGPGQVVGFQLPGELLGVEAISLETYPSTARALENSSVCELCLARLPESGRPLELLQGSIIELLGREVAFSHQLMSSLLHQSADQRIAGFLLNLSERLHRRGLSGGEFNLTMSRSDIGSYLGLASETVSRILSRFQKSRLIRLRRRRVRLIDRAALQMVASSAGQGGVGPAR